MADQAVNVTSSGSNPSIVARTACPRWIGPTPAGVPVKIRSPGANSTKVDNVAMISGTLQIIIERSPDWRVSPSIASAMLPDVAGTPGVKMEDAFRGIAWFLPAELFTTTVLFLTPDLVTWLPDLINR